MSRRPAFFLLAAAMLLPRAAYGEEKPAAEIGSAAALRPGDLSYTYGFGAYLPKFTPPAAGSYELPPIDSIGEHALVDAEGKTTTLGELVGGKLAVVSFIYLTCNESAGCPFANAVLHGLDAKLAERPELAKDVALVTISFDPARDTPARLAEMQKMRAPASSWRFVTAPDEARLEPLLEDFGQTISPLRNADGSATGVYRHVLKVFLLDCARKVRNVYSVGFLDAALVLADLETLKLEDAER